MRQKFFAAKILSLALAGSASWGGVSQFVQASEVPVPATASVRLSTRVVDAVSTPLALDTGRVLPAVVPITTGAGERLSASDLMEEASEPVGLEARSVDDPSDAPYLVQMTVEPGESVPAVEHSTIHPTPVSPGASWQSVAAAIQPQRDSRSTGLSLPWSSFRDGNMQDATLDFQPAPLLADEPLDPAVAEAGLLWNPGRVDSHGPIGVMGEHTHSKGEVMLSYRYMRMEMSGNRDRTTKVISRK